MYEVNGENGANFGESSPCSRVTDHGLIARAFREFL